MPKVIKSQLIEIVLPGISGGNTTTKLQFPDQPYLRGKQILGVEILTNLDATLSPSNRTPITAAQMLTSYLTLYLNDPSTGGNNVGEWIQNVPFTLLHRTQTGGATPTAFVRQMYELVGQNIYWEKSFISFPTAFNNTADVSFLLQVYFKG